MSPRKLSRREALKWMGVMSATAAIPMTLSAAAIGGASTNGDFAAWPQPTLRPVAAAGYGQDPNLIVPEPGPWPRIMTEPQLALLAVLSDIIVPAENGVPSASEVGVPDVLDEWISAPYPRQQEHRAVMEPGFLWMDNESQRRYEKPFIHLSEAQRLEIVDDIAFAERPVLPGLEMPGLFFSGLRSLVVGAFFTSPEGIKDLGYIGNTPIQGDYPGPTAEALVHLEELIERLGLRS
jgi:hypothetical protein